MRLVYSTGWDTMNAGNVYIASDVVYVSSGLTDIDCASTSIKNDSLINSIIYCYLQTNHEID